MGTHAHITHTHTLLQTATKIAEFPYKITMDKACLKEVNALEGVGKGSMDTVRVLSVSLLYDV